MKKIVDFTCNDDLTITLKFDDGIVRKIDFTEADHNLMVYEE